MKVELIPVVLQPPRERRPRSNGVHVSQVIRNLAVKNKALDKKWVNMEELLLFDLQDSVVWWNKLDAASRLRMAIGLAWEDWYIAEQLLDVIGQPGEMFESGIYMTHDGESVDKLLSLEGEWGVRLHEIKTTSKSTRWPIDGMKWWMAVTQCKAYCKGLSERYQQDVREADLHVLHVYGDYMKPYQPQIRRYHLTFEPSEIESTWEEIQGEVQHCKILEYEELMKDTYDAT